MSEARQEWLMRRLALYERAKALKFKQESLDREKLRRQIEIDTELEILKAETEKLFAEEPKE